MAVVLEEVIDWEKARAGDPAMLALVINRYRKLAYKVALKYRGKLDSDELISLAHLGLMKAARSPSFNPERAAFSTYMARAVDNEVLMVLRKNRRRSGTLSMQADIGMTGDGELPLENTIGTSENLGESVVERVFVREATSRVLQRFDTGENTDRLAAQCFRLWLSGVERAEVGKHAGISKAYGIRLLRRVIVEINKECRV